MSWGGTILNNVKEGAIVMKKIEKIAAAILIACMLIALMSPLALAAPTVSGAFYFFVGDTSEKGRQSVTISDASATTWHFELVDASGKFELGSSPAGAASDVLLIDGSSVTLYVGVKPGAVLELADNGQATVNVVGYGNYPSGGTTSTIFINVSENMPDDVVQDSPSMPYVSQQQYENMITKIAAAASAVNSGIGPDEIIEVVQDLIESDLDAFLAVAVFTSGYSPDTKGDLQIIEEAYVDAIGGIGQIVVTDEYAQTVFGLSDGEVLSDVALNALYNADNPLTLLGLSFAAPAELTVPDGEAAGLLFDAGSAVPLDIKLLKNETEEIHDTIFPVMITTGIPSGINAETLEVLHQTGGGWERLPSQALNGNVSFFTDNFSVFLFVNRTGYVNGGTGSGGDQSPAPIVPVIYDVIKTGDSFTFTAIIANANSSLPGATVEVKLNEKYTTTVTIEADGFGKGTIEAPGFTGTVANFSARVGGVGTSVTRPMVVFSNGKVVPK